MADQDMAMLLESSRRCEDHLRAIRKYTGWILALIVIPLVLSLVAFLGTCATV